MNNNSKNYKDDGGDTIVIGGDVKITSTSHIVIDKDANIEGITKVNKVENIEDSKAETIKAIRADFNLLLIKLRDAGIFKMN